MRIGMSEVLVILLAALILFGPSRLPEMGKALGKAIREFRNATSDLGKELEQVREEISRETPPATSRQQAKSAPDAPAPSEINPAPGVCDNSAVATDEDDAPGDADSPGPKPHSLPA